VAEWLEHMTQQASHAIASAGKLTSNKTPAFRRLEEDVWIQVGLGRFFSGQIRSALFFELYLKTGDPAAQQRAISTYQEARNAWAEMANRAAAIYRADVTFGETAVRRGHWLDRLPAIDLDLNAMRSFSRERAGDASKAIELASAHPTRSRFNCEHIPAKLFTSGEEITLTCVRPAGVAATLFYRHVDQAERWESVVLDGDRVNIPPAYSNTVFAIQYYFELTDAAGNVSLYPGFEADLANQPYLVISQRPG
jgi:hypothetical protein